jgi:hypothetical protein
VAYTSQHFLYQSILCGSCAFQNFIYARPLVTVAVLLHEIKANVKVHL